MNAPARETALLLHELVARFHMLSLKIISAHSHPPAPRAICVENANDFVGIGSALYSRILIRMWCRASNVHDFERKHVKISSQLLHLHDNPLI